MKTGLILFGVLLLVVGGIFYFTPTQTASATTTATAPGSTDTRTSSASLNLPWGITIGIIVLGLVFTILGFVLPSVNDVDKNKAIQTTYDVKTSKDYITAGGRKRHVTSERHVKRQRNK